MKNTLLPGINYQWAPPHPSLSYWVDSCWMLASEADTTREVMLLPDGRIDLLLSRSEKDGFYVALAGLTTMPEWVSIPARSLLFAVSFRLPAVEYIIQRPVASLLNTIELLPPGFWNFSENDLQDFRDFCKKAMATVTARIPTEMDSRKQSLFSLIYDSDGAATVKELSARAFWSSRQINRYFNQEFGLSLKTYLSILRFRSAFAQIREGKLFPPGHFTDQSHFIREVKKLSGVSPKVLSLNKSGRFIQFSALPPK